MSALPSAKISPIFARPDLSASIPIFHGGERHFWLATTSGAFFRLLERKIERVDAPFATPEAMTLEALDWDVKRKKLRGVAISKGRNQVAVLVEGEDAVILDGPALMGERRRRFLFTATGLVLFTWTEMPGAWEAFRFDEHSWVSLGETVAFSRCTLLIAEERTGAGRLVVLERRSGAIAVHDGKAWTPFDAGQVGVRAMLTDPNTGRVIVFDNDAANAAWRLDGEAWTEIPYSVPRAPTVRSFGVGSEAAVAGGQQIFFRGGLLQGRPATVGAIWDGKENVLTSWGVRCLDSEDGLHVEGDYAVFTSNDDDVVKSVPPFIRLEDGKLFETRAEAKLPAASAKDEAEEDDVLGPFATEARTGARIAAHKSGLVTIDAAGGHKRTKHLVEFTRIVALPGGGVFLGGHERSGKKALRYAYFDGTTLYELPIDPKARPAGLTDEKKSYDEVVDVLVDSKSGHVLAGFDDEGDGVGKWSAYLGAGKWLAVATASTSTEDEPVVWDDARRQLLTVNAVIGGVPMVGVFASPFGALLDAIPAPVANRFDVKVMKNPTAICAAVNAAKGATKPAKPPAPLVLAKGLALSYEMADSDVCDTYGFIVREAGDDELRVSYSPASRDAILCFTAAALESARRSVVISQHDHELGNEKEKAISKALPPFLVSRKVLHEMRKGKTTLNCEGPGDVTVTVKPAKRHIQHGDSSVEVKVLHGKSNHLEIWVLDDDKFPLVVRRLEGGDNYWQLLDIKG